MPAPDSVRLAMPAEAVDIARLQRRHWSRTPLLARAMAEVSADETVRAWHEAILKPPLAHCRVLVAIGQGQVVGFAVTGPSSDPDAEATDGVIAEFIVDEPGIDAHHGRLLNASVDTLRADGYETATIWIPSNADTMRDFLVETGWAADGAHREIGDAVGDASVKLVRLVTDITVD